MSTVIYVGLGANLGNTQATLAQATQAMAQWPKTTLEAVSPLYQTAPLDASGPDFLNAVAQLRTTLAPLEVLQALQHLEQTHGRMRPYHHAPRHLDLDLLLYGQRTLQTPTLTLPHPRLHERAFVLAPLADLAPELIVPGQAQPVHALLKAVASQKISLLK